MYEKLKVLNQSDFVYCDLSLGYTICRKKETFRFWSTTNIDVHAYQDVLSRSVVGEHKERRDA